MQLDQRVAVLGSNRGYGSQLIDAGLFVMRPDLVADLDALDGDRTVIGAE
jgi:hypothetical protein